MPRWHLFELEDQPWLPAPVRNGATDWLSFSANLSEMVYRKLVPRLADALRHTGSDRVVDLCSGGAGPLPTLLRMLKKREALGVRAVLTDLYPNLARLEHVAKTSGGAMEVRASPVDATDVPEDLSGFRTIFSGFHHFRPDMARAILEDAVKKRQGIAVVELLERRLPALVLVVLGGFVSVVVAPIIRPFSLSRIFFTWMVPLIPLTLMFDGIVSCLRVYSVSELEALVASLPDAGYRWQIERLAQGPLGITTLIGVPEALPDS